MHVAYFAEKAGLTPEEVAATWSGPPTDDVVAMVDDLHDTGTVGDELWARLSARFDDAQLLDVLLLAGWYHAIAFAANAAGVEPEPWAAVPPGGRTADLT